MLPSSGGDGGATKEGEKVYSGMFTDEISIGDMVWGTRRIMESLRM